MTDTAPMPTPSPEARGERFSGDELELALRNREMPLEALRDDVTPTGLHYLLNHFDMPVVDVPTWELVIGGLVGRPRSFSLPALEALPQHELTVTLECAGNGRSLMHPRHEGQPWRWGGVSTARWGGVPLAALLDGVDISPQARELVFAGADQGIEEGVAQVFERSLTVAEALSGGSLIATTMNGQALPPQHGAPARLIVPGWYGMASVKWLTSVTAVAEPFQGVQQWSYEARDDEDEPGEPCARIRPRALMVPPGIAGDEGRVIRGTDVELSGRAWSGSGAIVRVEVSVDGGPWTDAVIEASASPWAWSRWRRSLRLTNGAHELRCRATDATGAGQPDEAPWNVWGYMNNAPQRVDVQVVPS